MQQSKRPVVGELVNKVRTEIEEMIDSKEKKRIWRGWAKKKARSRKNRYNTPSNKNKKRKHTSAK